jgi:hypothetical protein
MGSRLLPWSTLAIGLALGAAVAYWVRSTPASAPASDSSAPGSARLAVALEEPGENPEHLPRIPPADVLPPEAATHPEYFEHPADQGEQGAPESLPARIEYARLDKIVAKSDIPHRTVGAWDEAPDRADPGARRALVVVVEPSISDDALEALARDLRAQHTDARILNVRIFDSEDGARRASWVDGGQFAHEHLVGQVSINSALGLDVIRVRGRRVEP